MTATTTGAASQASTTPQANGNGQEPLQQVTDLQMHFPLTRGIIFQRKVGAVQAVDGVSFSVVPGGTLGLVGESGCGKSTIAKALVGLAQHTGRIEIAGQARQP